MRIAVPGAGELQCELSSLFHAYTKRFRISSNLCACALQYLVGELQRELPGVHNAGT